MWIRFLLFPLLLIPAAAQFDPGQIVGFITDASGGAITVAEITVTNEATRETRTVQPNEGGLYVVTSL